MVNLYIQSYVLILISIGIHPEVVLSTPPVIEAFADDTRIVGYIKFENSSRTECFIYSDSGNELPINEGQVTKLNSSEIDELIKNCSKNYLWQTEETQREKRAIFPGTKWCGVGNIAHSYSDLGRERKLDKCCREHDHCPDFIKPFTYKYGLFNWSLFTRSHCSCDRKFKDCLKQEELTENTSATLVYNMFFKFLNITCFEKKTAPVCIKSWVFICLRHQYIKKWSFSKV